jgi:hypothetical protein
MLGMMFCSSNASQSGETVKKDNDQFDRRWIEQKAETITIPRDIGGEAEVIRNFYFIMDGSGSMRERTTRNCGGDQKFRSKMAGAQWAIKKFLEFVPDDVNIGLYIFDQNGQREVVSLGTGNRDLFINAVNRINAASGTPLAQAIRYGTDKLVEQYKRQLGYGEFRLVVITDGEAAGIPEAALYAARFGVPIYAIGLCVGQDHPLRKYSVSYRAADNFADLSQGLQDTLAELPDFDVTEFENNSNSNSNRP